MIHYAQNFHVLQNRSFRIKWVNIKVLEFNKKIKILEFLL